MELSPSCAINVDVGLGVEGCQRRAALWPLAYKALTRQQRIEQDFSLGFFGKVIQGKR
jgi:hypothetical protein